MFRKGVYNLGCLSTKLITDMWFGQQRHIKLPVNDQLFRAFSEYCKFFREISLTALVTTNNVVQVPENTTFPMTESPPPGYITDDGEGVSSPGSNISSNGGSLVPGYSGVQVGLQRIYSFCAHNRHSIWTVTQQFSLLQLKIDFAPSLRGCQAAAPTLLLTL